MGGEPTTHRRSQWSQVKQRIGRALRMCSHEGLAGNQRALSIEIGPLPPAGGARPSLFVAVHKVTDLPVTLDEEKYRIVDAERRRTEEAMQRLRAASIDADYYLRSR